MKDALLLVFANKQDLNGAMRPKEVSDRLQLEKIAKDHVWKVEPSCATTGEGIFEGLVRHGSMNPSFEHDANIITGMALQQRQAPRWQQINISVSHLHISSNPTRLHAHWLPAYTRLLDY
jgi:hypothetical protein